ncbi:unnamed protein product [Rotaria magnacalcarata]|uniref:Uncharacterized protein n=1 Tax=Rotaria magnacalcarata TaxID=392030 RepID=A0A816RGT4_9BILA|nr:unnamed protein product [Rotaria magnacalcarata]CAF2154967.1 unnamed protein product [Rotaria magnacalcarata]CAF4073162.1 unnamed protein product [Rotaria magnacalcarata]CAF4167013.1 unnamed protein product [Rotaria magnacalcarata]
MSGIGQLKSDVTRNKSQISSIEGEISTERQKLNNNALSQAERGGIETLIQDLETKKAQYEEANNTIRAEINELEQQREQQLKQQNKEN